MIEAKVYEKTNKKVKPVFTYDTEEQIIKPVKIDNPKKKRFTNTKRLIMLFMLLIIGLFATLTVHSALIIIAIYTTAIFFNLVGGFRE